MSEEGTGPLVKAGGGVTNGLRGRRQGEGAGTPSWARDEPVNEKTVRPHRQGSSPSRKFLSANPKEKNVSRTR